MEKNEYTRLRETHMALRVIGSRDRKSMIEWLRDNDPGCDAGISRRFTGELMARVANVASRDALYLPETSRLEVYGTSGGSVTVENGIPALCCCGSCGAHGEPPNRWRYATGLWCGWCDSLIATVDEMNKIREEI